MRTILCSIHALIVAALVTGCSPSVWVRVYNNTPETIFVSAARKRFVVPAASQIRFEPGIDNTTSFLVEIGTQRIAYQIKGVPIPKPFWSDKRGCVDLSLQLQGDHKIYIVHPCSTFPVQNLPKQPTGFPLGPVRAIE